MMRRIQEMTRPSVRENQKGAMMVEYAIIFPFVILCVCVIVYMGLIYYQQALLQSVVSENAQNWALLWGYDAGRIHSAEGIVGREAYESEALYWNLFTDVNKKNEYVRETIERQFLYRSIIKPVQDVKVDIAYRNYLVIQKLNIHASVSYSLPAKGFFQSMGLSGEISLKTCCEETIQDPREFIHNIDYLLQLYDETGARAWVEEKCEPLVKSLQKIKDYLN